MEERELDNLADKVARKVADLAFRGKHGRELLREVVLRVVVEQERERVAGAVWAFVDAAESRGVRIWANDRGVLCSREWDKLGADLRAVLISERRAVTEYFCAIRDSEKRDAERQRATVIPMKKAQGK
jgi:hypothetical protein